MLLSGEARLKFEDEPAPRLLKPGDHLDIAAHRRHRVESTTAPAVWLAVHYDRRESPRDKRNGQSWDYCGELTRRAGRSADSQ